MNDLIKNMFIKIKNRLFGHYETVVDFTDIVQEKDKQASKISAALGYLCFIIPMVLHEDKQFARFHCNQSFLNLLLSTIGAMLLSFIPYVGVYLVIILEILCVIIAVRGFIQAFQGKAKSIPLIGWITIIAYRYPEQA